MKPSKPLNADDELREEIDDILQQVGNYWYCVAKETTDTRTMSEGEALDKIMQLILADRKKHELQARCEAMTNKGESYE